MPGAVYARIAMAYDLASAVLPENCGTYAESRVSMQLSAAGENAVQDLRVHLMMLSVGSQTTQPPLTGGAWGAGTPPPRPRRLGAPRGWRGPRTPQRARVAREKFMQKPVSGSGPSEYESAGPQPVRGRVRGAHPRKASRSAFNSGTQPGQVRVRDAYSLRSKTVGQAM